VTLAQLVVDLGAAFARAVDLLVDVLERSHADTNVGRRACIPGV
jgi:hypothetical protein